MTMAEGDLAVAEIAFVQHADDCAAAAAGGNDRRARLAARQSSVDAFNIALTIVVVAAAGLGHPGAGQVPGHRCGVERERPRRLPGIRPASRDRCLLAVRLGAAAVFHLRLLSDSGALAGGRLLHHARVRHWLAIVAQRAAARSGRHLFLRGAADHRRSFCWPAGRRSACAGGHRAVGRRPCDDRCRVCRHCGLTAAGNTSGARPALAHAGGADRSRSFSSNSCAACRW